MRTECEYRTASAENYRRFCDLHPDIDISVTLWRKIIYDYNYATRDYILDSGDIGKLPFGIGHFAISKKKPLRQKTDPQGRVWMNMPIDWQKTKLAGKYIYNFNNHTDGYRYRWKWFTKTSRFYMSSVWRFRAFRTSARKLAEYIKRPGSKYSEIYKQW